MSAIRRLVPEGLPPSVWLILIILGGALLFWLFNAGGFDSLDRTMGDCLLLVGLMFCVALGLLSFPRFTVLGPWMLLLFWGILSIAWTWAPDAAIGEALHLTALVVLFLTCYSLSRAGLPLTWPSAFFLGVLGIEMVIGYRYYAMGHSGSIVAVNQMVRYFYGTFFWKNPMGGFLVLVLPLTIALLWTARSLPWRVVAFLLACAGGGALLLTQSRAAILIGGAAILLWLFLEKRLLTWKRGLSVIAIALVALTILLLWGNLEQITSRSKDLIQSATGRASEEAVADRTTMYRIALEMYLDHPITGIGWGGYPAGLLGYLKGTHYLSKYAHSHYLQALAELGLPGLLLWIWILLIAVPVLYRFISPWPEPERLRAGGLLFGLLALAVHAGVDFDLSLPFLAASAALVLGCLFGQVDRQQAGVHPSPGKLTRLPLWGLILLALVLLTLRGMAENDYRELVAARGEGRLSQDTYAQQLKGILRKSPFSPNYRSDLVTFYQSTGQRDSARQQIEILERIDPRNPDHFVEEARVALSRGDTTQALTALNKAITLAPHSRPEAHLLRARVLIHTGKALEGRRYLEGLLGEYDLNPEAYYTERTVAYRYMLATVSRILAGLARDGGDSLAAVKYDSLTGLLQQPRGVDAILANQGIDATSPERVLADYWLYTSQGRSTAAESLLDQAEPLVLPDTCLCNGVEAILDVSYSNQEGSAGVTYLLPVICGERRLPLVRTAWLRLIGAYWKIARL